MNQIEQLEEQILGKEKLDVTQKIQIIPEDLSMYGSSDPQEQQVLRKHQDILEQDYPNQPLCISFVPSVANHTLIEVNGQLSHIKPIFVNIVALNLKLPGSV
jgi:hypothetical protein